MVATPRSRSTELSHSSTDELIIARSEQITRSPRPSARERFAKHVAASNSSTTRRSSSNSFASRLIKTGASRSANRATSPINSQSSIDESLHSVQRTFDAGPITAADPSSWFTGARISSSSSGVVGSGSLQVLGAAVSHSSGGGHGLENWRRSASEGRPFFSRPFAFQQPPCADQLALGTPNTSQTATQQAPDYFTASNNGSAQYNMQGMSSRMSSGAGLVTWALQDEIQQWQMRQQQKLRQQQQQGQHHPWPEQPPAWMLPQQQQQQQDASLSPREQLLQAPAWMLPQRQQQQQQQQEAALSTREPSLPCTSTTVPADCALVTVNGTSSHLFSLPGPRSSWSQLSFGSPAGTGAGDVNVEQACQPGGLLQANLLDPTLTTERAGSLAPGTCTAVTDSTFAGQAASQHPSLSSTQAAAGSSAFAAAASKLQGQHSSASAAATAVQRLQGQAGALQAPPSSNSGGGLGGGPGSGPGNSSPLNSTSSNPYIISLQQQLARLKRAHALITQDVVPETPPSAIAASVAILFDPSRSDHDCSTYMQQQLQQQQQEQALQEHQQLHQQLQQQQQQQGQAMVKAGTGTSSNSSTPASHHEQVSVQPAAANTAVQTGPAATTAAAGHVSSAAATNTAAAAAGPVSGAEVAQLDIRKSSTVSWPKAAGDVAALLTDSSISISSGSSHCGAQSTGLHTREDHMHPHAAPAMARVDEHDERAEADGTAAAAAADNSDHAAQHATEDAGNPSSAAAAAAAVEGSLRSTYSGGRVSPTRTGGNSPSNSPSNSPRPRRKPSITPIGDAIQIQQQQQQLTRNTASAEDLREYAQHYCYPSAAVAAGIPSPRASSSGGRRSTGGQTSATTTGPDGLQTAAKTVSTGAPAAATAAAEAAQQAELLSTNPLMTRACCPARCLLKVVLATAGSAGPVCATAAAAAAAATSGKITQEATAETAPVGTGSAAGDLVGDQDAGSNGGNNNSSGSGSNTSTTEVLETEINLRADWTESNDSVAAAAAAAGESAQQHPQSPRSSKARKQLKSPRHGSRTVGPAIASEGFGAAVTGTTAAAAGGGLQGALKAPNSSSNSPRNNSAAERGSSYNRGVNSPRTRSSARAKDQPKTPSGYAAVLLRQQQQSANKAQAAAATAAAAAAAAAAEAAAAAAAVEAAAAAVEAQNCQSDKGSATNTAASAVLVTSGQFVHAAQSCRACLMPQQQQQQQQERHCNSYAAADAEVAAATAAAAARAVAAAVTLSPRQAANIANLSRGCSPVPPLILPTAADLMPDMSRLRGSTPDSLNHSHVQVPQVNPATVKSAAAAALAARGQCATSGAASDAPQMQAAVLVGSVGGSSPTVGQSSFQFSPRQMLEGSSGSLFMHQSTADMRHQGGSSSAAESAAADARYAELLARLQTFMPALRAATTPGVDFEATWQVVKAELSALASAARLASLQAGRLEALDSEVVKLQRLLALVGKHIKAGAQQHQLYDLVRSFPAFAQQLDTMSDTASPRGQQQQQPLTPRTHTALTAAAAAATTPAQEQQQGNPLQQLIASLAAAAAAAPSKAADLSISSSTAGSCSRSASPSGPRSQLSAGMPPSPSAAAAGGGGVRGSGKYPSRPQSPVKQQPWVNPLYGSNRRPSPERAQRDAYGRSGNRSPTRGQPHPQSPATERSSAPKAVPPPLKTLTPDESARLMGLYKVRTMPEKISYKTMWVPGKSAGSPHASPPRERRSPSPVARAQLSPRPSRTGDAQHGELDGRALSRSTSAVGDYLMLNSAGRSIEGHLCGSSSISSSTAREPDAGNLTTWRRLGAIMEDSQAAGSAPIAMVGTGISASDTKRALDWLEQQFGSSGHDAAPAIETEQIISALRNMIGAAAAAAADDSLGQRPRSSSNTPIRSSISFAEDVEQQQRVQRQRQQQQQQQQSFSLRLSQSTSALHGEASTVARSSSSNNGGSQPRASLPSPRTPAYYSPSHRSASPMGFVYRPKSAQGEQQQRQQQQRQQGRRRSSDHMRMSSSWDCSPLQAVGSWGAPLPTGCNVFGSTSSLSKPRSGKFGGSAALRSAVNGGMGLMTGGGNGVLLADDPAFQEACKMFRTRHQQQAAAGRFINSNALPRVSSAAQQLAVRLSPTKDADAQTVADTIKFLCMTLQQHGVPLDLERVSTFTYSAAGRKLHVRILNGNLLVRTGGGYQDLLDALGKLPAPNSFTHSSPLSTSAAVATANNILAAASSISSPRTPVLNAGPFTGGKSSSDQEGALYKQRSSSGCDSATATFNKLHSGGHTHTLGVGAGSANSPTMGVHARLDLSGLHSSMFGSHRGSTPMGSARSRVDPSADVAAGGCGRRQSVGPTVAFEAAVQAAVAAAVEAAANAGLDDGMGTSCGGAAPGSSITARQQSRAALLGRVIAAKTAAGTLIEAGMCPPVPVQEEVGSPSSRRASAAAAEADLGSESNA